MQSSKYQQSQSMLSSITRWEVRSAIAVIGFVLILCCGLYGVSAYFEQRIAPSTSINGVSVGSLTREEALKKLSEQDVVPSFEQLTIFVDDISISSNAAELRVIQPHTELVDKAEKMGKHQVFLLQALNMFKAALSPTKLNMTAQFDSSDLAALLAELNKKVTIVGEKPSAALKTSGIESSISINPGKPGRTISSSETVERAQAALRDGVFQVPAVVASTSTPLSPEAQEVSKKRVAAFVNKKIALQIEDAIVPYADTALVQFLQLPNGYDKTAIASEAAMLANKFNRPPSPAEFTYDPTTLIVSKFVPNKPGIQLSTEHAETAIRSFLEQVEKQTEVAAEKPIELTFVETKAATTLAETNNLGITERIGIGKSEYSGSILTRVHNVGITAERITNHIVRPGEEFSFNKALGEVSAKTGFKPAYVIRSGRTELGDGGGVCQVSSTLFRALLDSGLDITRRLQHSYRVGYYELNSDPGFDATVYSGNVDLRFKNDTENHVLIHVINDNAARTMQIELYGTSDGRRTEVTDYQKWGAIGAPASEYILDPTLQPGQRVQIDWAVGGLKTKFTHKVYKSNGELMRENAYYSNYRPWSAKYRVGSL